MRLRLEAAFSAAFWRFEPKMRICLGLILRRFRALAFFFRCTRTLRGFDSFLTWYRTMPLLLYEISLKGRCNSNVKSPPEDVCEFLLTVIVLAA